MKTVQRSNYCYTIFEDTEIYKKVSEEKQKQKAKQEIAQKLNRSLSGVSNRFHFLSSICQRDIEDAIEFSSKYPDLSKKFIFRIKE